MKVFKINRRTDYAVRVMLCLAKRPAGTRLSTQAVQDEMMIPRAFLQRIIADLSRAELIRTFAGPSGGLELARPAAEIHLKHIWEAIEGPLQISECVDNPGACPLRDGCPVCRRWRKLQALIASELEAIDLASLVIEANQLGRPAHSTLDTLAAVGLSKGR